MSKTGWNKNKERRVLIKLKAFILLIGFRIRAEVYYIIHGLSLNHTYYFPSCALRLLIMNAEEGMLMGNFINPLLSDIKAAWQLCCFFTEENLHCAAGIFTSIRLKE